MVFQESNSSKKKILIFFIILIAGIFLRFYNLNFEDYWFDEQAGFWVSDPTISFTETLNRSNQLDRGTHVLFNLILKNFFAYFNYDTEFGRIIPLIFGVLSIPAISYLSYQIKKNQSFILVAFLSSINFYLISYSQELRLYSLLYLLSILNIIFFYKIFENETFNRRKILNSVLYIFISSIGVSLHIFFFIIIFSQIVYILLNFYFYKKKQFFNLFCILTVAIIYLVIMLDSLLLQIGIKEFWIQQVKIDFFYNFFFSRFFGSKIMGVIFLLTLFYLIFQNKKVVFKINNKYFLLVLILFFSYFLPIFYSLFQKPILIDRYIIFVLIPIITLISNLTFDLTKNKIKYIILFIILSSSLTNNYIEIFKRKILKPEFNKSLSYILTSNVKNVIIKSNDNITEEITINYARNTKSAKNNNINFINSNKDYSKLEQIWYVCYQPINNFDCSTNGYSFSSWNLEDKINYKLIETSLYKR